MKYENRIVNGDIVQITTSDERWYQKKDSDIYVPSITWIGGHYPKGKGFEIYLKQQGDNADILLEEAGDKGSRVHAAIEDLLNEKEVSIEDKYFSKIDEKEKDLTAEEWEAIMSFSRWFSEVEPEVVAVETQVFKDPTEEFPEGFAGTVDLVCKIDGENWIVDFKTSKDIHDSHRIQLSAYKNIIEENGKKYRIATLQVGYARNKKKFKFTEIEDDIDGFKLAYRIWQREVKKKKPLQREYPLKIKL